MYLADHYVRIGGTVYAKGEAVPDGLPAGMVEWLTKSGAIHEAPGQKPPEPGPEPDPPQKAQKKTRAKGVKAGGSKAAAGKQGG